MKGRKFVGDCIGQGTAGAALVSQVNLDCGLMEYFEDSKDEVSYGSVRLQPLAYQDDIMRGSRDVLCTQVGNIKMAAMMEEKGLEAHPDKTCYIVCGSRRFKEKVMCDLQSNPIMFGQFPVKQRESDRYLGQMLHSGGLDMCAVATVQERVGRIKGATMEIKGIIEEFQMQVMGGMMAAVDLWEKALIPSLLSGSGTWFGGNDCKAAVEMCDNVQNFFWRVMLTVPESCPKIALKCETGMLGMKWRIWTEKILLLMRIRKQSTDTLSRQVYEESRARGWPGLGEEVTLICNEIGVPDVNTNMVTKAEVKKAVWEHHYTHVKKELGESTKLMDIKDEDFTKVQDYFKDKSVENARMAFKVRCKMVPDIPCNFKNKYKRRGEQGILCSYCKEGEEFSQNHCLECPTWADIRKGLDLTNIMDLVVFFRRLLAERARLDKESVAKTASHDPCSGSSGGCS